MMTIAAVGSLKEMAGEDWSRTVEEGVLQTAV
jgi:hypothetical protein